MKEKILRKALKIAIAILLFIPIFVIAINSELIIGDELWNFQNIVKLKNGGTMYVDCNIIITPLFYVIGYFFVKFITGTILGFRIYNAIIFLFLLMTTFYLFISLKQDKLKSFIYTLITSLFVMPYVTVGANYNVLAEAVFVLGLVMFLNKKKIKFYDLFQGIIIFACIFTKQNIGLYYLIALVIAEITVERKEAVHDIIREIMVSVLCTLFAVIIMCKMNCYQEFLNYTILGMKEFTSENSAIDQAVKIVIIGYWGIAFCSYILGFITSRKNKEILENIKILTLFSIFLNISALPIANLYHTSFSIFLNVVIFLYVFENLLFYKLKNRKVLYLIAIALYIVINSYGLICGYRASKNVKIKDIENVYFSSNISNDLNNQLQDVAKYIFQKEKEGIDVICISADSPLYMVYLNKNHGALDLCFKGNLGLNGQEEVINKVKQLENTEIIMNNEMYWQEIEELRDYVFKNYIKVESIQNVSIFKAK